MAPAKGEQKKRGFTIWLTGFPCSGKSTLAGLLHAELARRGLPDVEVLDGDVVRTYLSKGLGYSREDRDTNIRRIGWVCQLLAKHGIPTIVAAIAPYRETRDEVRRLVQAVGGKGSFVEVYVQCPLEVCEQRDLKGLYRRARLGEIKNFTGVSDPYEPPVAPEIVVDTAKEEPAESAKKILSTLAVLGLA